MTNIESVRNILQTYQKRNLTNYLISTISNSNDLFRRHHSLVAIIHALHFVDEDLLNLYKKGVATGLIHKYEK